MKQRGCFAVLIVACLIGIAAARLSSQVTFLVVEREGERLRVSAPRFHFLDGKPLEQLQSGATVAYILSLGVYEAGGGRRFAHHEARFVVSYDLWEERFSVVAGSPPHRSASHLTAGAAEAWCLDHMRVAIASVPAEKTVVVKLACSVHEDDPPPGEGLTLSALIDILSRKGTTAPPRWDIASRPLRLGEVQDASQR